MSAAAAAASAFEFGLLLLLLVLALHVELDDELAVDEDEHVLRESLLPLLDICCSHDDSVIVDILK